MDKMTMPKEVERALYRALQAGRITKNELKQAVAACREDRPLALGPLLLKAAGC